MYPVPITPRNKIEELQQRKEADLKAQLARTQKLQQELEAANQVRGTGFHPQGVDRAGNLGGLRPMKADWRVRFPLLE